MFTSPRTAVLAALILSLGASFAVAEPSLKVGDKAPDLALGTWFKGEPVKEIKEGEVYIIECWATWCGPCITAIPHVTELQKKYADKKVTVIGVCVWDSADDEKVAAFVAKQGDKMDYRVAREHREDPTERAGTMAETWLKAAGRNGIPCSFIVDRSGKIAWIGHPMRMDGPLEKIVAGTFDAEKEAKVDAAITEAQTQYSSALRGKDWDAAMKALDMMAELRPEDAAGLVPARLNILALKGDADGARAIASKAIDGAKSEDDIRTLVGVASIMIRPGAARDMDVAQKAGEKAVELSKRKDGFALHTLARVHAAKDEKEKAIALYEEAIKGADDERLKRYLESELSKIKDE